MLQSGFLSFHKEENKRKHVFAKDYIKKLYFIYKEKLSGIIELGNWNCLVPCSILQILITKPVISLCFLPAFSALQWQSGQIFQWGWREVALRHCSAENMVPLSGWEPADRWPLLHSDHMWHYWKRSCLWDIYFWFQKYLQKLKYIKNLKVIHEMQISHLSTHGGVRISPPPPREKHTLVLLSNISCSGGWNGIHFSLPEEQENQLFLLCYCSTTNNTSLYLQDSPKRRKSITADST